VTTRQDQESQISTPDDGIEEPTATTDGHAFWRHAAGPGGATADPAEAEKEPATTRDDPGDAAAEPTDGVSESDDAVIVVEPANAQAGPGDAETEPTSDLTEGDGDAPDEDVIVAEPDDIIVAEVIDGEPRQPSGAAHPAQAGDSPGAGIAGFAPAAGTELSQQWRDIQAAFVDDPRDAVGLAAEAAEAAVNGVIDVLRSRREALGAAAGDSAEHRDTEQLRGELRQYRALCQNLAEIGRRLARRQPA
jgi:hypothetical protein